MSTNVKKVNMKKLVIGLGLVAAMSVAGIAAYFTATDTATNTFDVGKIDIELLEPSWVEPTDITPNQVINKDPQVKNTASNDAFVFLTVEVPYQNIITANADGTRNAAADTELFSWAVKDGWVQVGEAVKDTDAETVTYLYAYAANDEMTAVAADTITGALFDTVLFCNAIEGQGLEETTEDIVINAYGIQTTDLTDADVTAPADVWNIYANQNSIVL